MGSSELGRCRALFYPLTKQSSKSMTEKPRAGLSVGSAARERSDLGERESRAFHLSIERKISCRNS